MQNPMIYLDHAATTPTDPRVVEAMMPYFTQVYGNASSAHQFGRDAESAIEDARARVARVLNCTPNEVVFTSGGSEGDNLAVRGAAWGAKHSSKGNHLITTPIEHSAVVKTLQQLAETQGFTASLLPVDSCGMVNPNDLETIITEQTSLVSVMYANNEVGSVEPIAELAAVAHAHGAIFHTDAVQAAGQLPLDVQALGVDMLSLSAHKFYGPKGVGALYIRNGVELLSSQTGGSHENGRRAGTHNTPFIVGMAKALELAYDEYDARISHYRQLRDQLIDGITARVPDVIPTGHAEKRLPSHASFIFTGVDANTLIIHLDLKGVAASSASACKVGNSEPSSVLLALGYSRDLALGSLRLTVGQQTTEADIDYAVDAIAQSVEKVRKIGAFR
ncbi:MAG: cysteine desulfurase family protein [Phototrophicaceae bacterium]|jgi:cysteine desulfurase